MTIKDKIIFLTLSIATLGIYPFVILNRKGNVKTNTLSVGEKVTINIDKMLETIGKGNVKGVSSTHTKVKIEITPDAKIDVDNIKKLKGISGIFATSTSLTILVGNSAKTIATEIERRI